MQLNYSLPDGLHVCTFYIEPTYVELSSFFCPKANKHFSSGIELETELTLGEKLPKRRQKKTVTSILIAMILGLIAWSTYTAGNVELSFGFAVLALLALLLGLLD